MESSEKSKQCFSVETTDDCLAVAILESGYGLREWANSHGRSISEINDATLRELASNPELRVHVLNSIDHSAAKVFFETGEPQFDRFSGTVFAMQTLSRGLDMKPALEQLSLELLDPFVELRRQGRVTRVWLRALLSKRYRLGGRIYRFGELSRIALLAAALLGFHDEDPLFVWALENHEGIEGAAPQQWSRIIRDALKDEGCPQFALRVVKDHGREIVRKVSFDTYSQ